MGLEITAYPKNLNKERIVAPGVAERGSEDKAQLT
jgi:hypothetical protein